MKIGKIALVLILFSLIGFIVNAIDECGNEVESGVKCQVTTPKIECATYDLYNTTNSLNIDDGTLVQLGTTGVYYFNFSQSTTGKYTFILCSNDTSSLTVVSSTQHNKLDSTLSGIQSNRTETRTYLDSNFTSAMIKLTSLMIGMVTNSTDIKSNISTQIDTVDSTLLSLLSGVQSNSSSIKSNISLSKDLMMTNFSLRFSSLDWDLDSVLRGIQTNTTWLSTNVVSTATVNVSQIWNYNITTYNVSGDYHSAGAYLRALEVYRYG